MPYEDLRQYLKVLEEKGLLCHVQAEVDKDWEISAVCRRTFRTIPQERRPALMFDCIKGHNIPLVVGILGGSREIQPASGKNGRAPIILCRLSWWIADPARKWFTWETKRISRCCPLRSGPWARTPVLITPPRLSFPATRKPGCAMWEPIASK